MARIRSIKPGFCTSEDIAALSIPCRLHFAMLWTYADDDGRGADNLRLIKGALWPLDDDVTPATIDGWQSELERNGRICRYVDGGRSVFEIRDFRKHQKPNRPTPSDIREASRLDWAASSERYGIAPCSLPDPSMNDPVGVIPVVEGRGGEDGCVSDAVSMETELSTVSTEVAEAEVVGRAVNEARKALGKTRSTTVTPMFKKKDPA